MRSGAGPELRARLQTLYAQEGLDAVQAPPPSPQVLDLNDVLVSKHWTRKKGWTLYKRPGAQDFLFEMGQYFEIVIYTDEPSAYATPVINKLDKAQVCREGGRV